MAMNGEACEMEFAYVLPSGESFTFTVHAVYRPRCLARAEGHVSATPQVGTGCGGRSTNHGET
jgi:hypothetical protein